MAAPAQNPLMSSQKGSQLQTVLHPLVLLAISDYVTRHSLRCQEGPIVGALLGQQNGREITIEHVFDCHTRATSGVEGGYLLDVDRFAARLEQMMTVHKERQLDLVGWYTLFPTSGPTPSVVPIHKQILQQWNESALLLGFHPEEALKHSVGGKLPLTIYESNYEVDDSGGGAEGDEDKRMDDGEAAALKLKFREVPYSVETDDTEMISMNYIAGAGGNASTVSGTASAKEDRPARSVESNGKGKRRLVESEADDTAKSLPDADEVLTHDEEKTLASLTAKANAIKMLHARLRLIATYLERLPPSPPQTTEDSMDTDSTTPSHPILRQIQALVTRLDLVIPSDGEAFAAETLHQANDVELLGLLNSVMQAVGRAREVGRKSAVVENGKAASRRGPTGLSADSMFSLSSAGDIFL
ncbi:COP9 signalosome complex subunit 6 [Ophiocordyceps camponoti-floridani]|uniref:COP9 signalosome complex subunit 6 n=1 Tax=Ophiocordyceps camponoti-floridani TaxID=2030778 RepID=A0A8H4VD50_9HYPO|nr:COP9 signalosome complex subunit 6 [Ophiocordyceps camponoti-floridani]